MKTSVNLENLEEQAEDHDCWCQTVSTAVQDCWKFEPWSNNKDPPSPTTLTAIDQVWLVCGKYQKSRKLLSDGGGGPTHKAVVVGFVHPCSENIHVPPIGKLDAEQPFINTVFVVGSISCSSRADTSELLLSAVQGGWPTRLLALCFKCLV